MSLVDAPRPATISQTSLDKLPWFRLRSEAIPDGQYKIKGPEEAEVDSVDDKIQSKLWFKTPVRPRCLICSTVGF
jgi:hypothetical protein